MKQVKAHSPGGDAGIEAIMHVEPSDRPGVNKESNFYFIFKDPAGIFEIERCDCSIKLLKNEQLIDQRPVVVADSAFSSLGSQPLYTRTFTDTGNYELELSGVPKNGATFQSFTLHYEVSVTDNPVSGAGHHTTMATEHIGHILIFGGGLVACLVILARNYYQNRKQNIKKE